MHDLPTPAVSLVSHRKPVRPIWVGDDSGWIPGHCGTWHRWDRDLQDGDGILYRRDATLASLVIASVTQCPWVHVGMIAWNDDEDRWEIIETVQWHGGRRISLVEAVRANPGHWDWFRANPDNRWPEFDRQAAVAKMEQFVGRRYGWLSLARDGLSHLPLLGGLAGELADDGSGLRLPFCSQAATIAWRAGGVDPVSHRRAQFCEPVHVAQSLFLEYGGTFFPADVPQDE